MPLFDAIESDVTAFFVSQGTVFDSLVKAFMDRMAVVESSVALLRTHVTNNFNLVNQRIDASTAQAQEIAASTAAKAATAAATAAASAALASLPPPPAAEVSLITTPDNVKVVDSGGGRNEELEYHIMTLSRQLNMVLEVLFQPHGNNNVVDVVQAKQTQLQSISDVLTENEAILMQLAAQHDEGKVVHFNPGAESGTSDNMSDIASDEATQVARNQQLVPEQKPVSEVTTVPRPATSLKDRVQKPQSPPSETSTLPSVAAKEARQDVDQQVPLPTSEPHLDAANKEQGVPSLNKPDNQITENTRDEQDEDSDKETDEISSDLLPFQLLPEASRHRRKSFFQSCQDLQRQEEARLREQKRLEEELMRRMHELLLQSRSHRQQEHMEQWRAQQNEVTQNQQTMIFNLQNQLQEQLQLHQQREQEWCRQQEEQRMADIATIQQEIDRKWENLNSMAATAQSIPSQDLTQVKQLMDDLDKRFVSPDALQEAGALWLKTAADNCIYGANPEILSNLHRDLQEFKFQLNSHPVKSPAVSSLHEAVDRAIQLLHPVTSSDNITTGTEQENTMYTLRQLLAKVDTSYRAAATEHEEFPLPAVVFLAEAIHRMELGTANLLDAIDFQQEHFQQTLSQHQTGLDKLQKELWRQQEVELGLRTQLGACPSQEDTLRLVQDLRDQIAATTADSASKMLDTVEDLRYRMAGLPNAQMLEQLASDLHAKTDRLTLELDTTAGKLSHDLRQKADRSEIDRLQSLVQSSNGVHLPPAYLTKSPLKCLSCDQHLPFAQAPLDDNMAPNLSPKPGSPTSQRPGSPPRSPPRTSPRPIIYHNQQSQQLTYQDQPYSGSSQSSDVYNDLGINMEILQEMFAASTSALERRRRQRQHLQMQLLSPQPESTNAWVVRNPTYLNIDDGRNRIPLRKVQLSDQVIYGPAITPNAFRKKQLGRSDE
ncbi:hypothetical protein F442_19897 [Phytophthora nicotianae P10297]|uniref:Uncharacterized protein n=1 Tax=Phytophthora nicotianae P10297 TaxID=1317064 RepID=W2Y9D0_PHYNI|nr:hypothetical protein F442_19897 [Phytophthora nicotianae P10297]